MRFDSLTGKLELRAVISEKGLGAPCARGVRLLKFQRFPLFPLFFSGWSHPVACGRGTDSHTLRFYERIPRS